MNMPFAAPSPSTPCVQICVVDPRSKLCIGCGRTVGEIASWPRLDEAARHVIMAQLDARLLEARSRRARSRGLAARGTG